MAQAAAAVAAALAATLAAAGSAAAWPPRTPYAAAAAAAVPVPSSADRKRVTTFQELHAALTDNRAKVVAISVEADIAFDHTIAVTVAASSAVDIACRCSRGTKCTFTDVGTMREATDGSSEFKSTFLQFSGGPGTGARSVVISNCVFNGAPDHGIRVRSTGLINADAAFYLIGCTFTRNGDNGIWIEQGHLVVSECRFLNNFWDGIHTHHYGSGQDVTITVENSTFQGNNDGVYIRHIPPDGHGARGVERLVVRNCWFSNDQWGLGALNNVDGSLLLSGNTFDDNGSADIDFGGKDASVMEKYDPQVNVFDLDDLEEALTRDTAGSSDILIVIKADIIFTRAIAVAAAEPAPVALGSHVVDISCDCDNDAQGSKCTLYGGAALDHFMVVGAGGAPAPGAIRLSNCILDGNAGAVRDGLVISSLAGSGSAVILEGCDFVNFRSHGVTFTAPGSLVALGCTFSGSTGSGVYVGEAALVDLEDSVFKGNGKHGAWISGASTGVVVKSSSFTDNGISGIELGGTIGDLAISETDLTNLGSILLEEVDGNVEVTRNPSLRLLHLQNVTSVGGYVVVVNNRALTEIVMDELESIDSFVEFGQNPMLENLSLPALEEVKGYVAIWANGALTSVSMSELQTTDTEVAIWRSNPAMQSPDFDAFIDKAADASYPLRDCSGVTITTLAGVNDCRNGTIWSIDVECCRGTADPTTCAPDDVDVVFLENLTTVAELRVVGCTGLQEIAAPRLTMAAGGLILIDNDALRSVSFESLAVTGNVEVERSGALQHVRLPSLTLVDGHFEVSHNGELESVAIGNLALIEQDLIITHNHKLASLNLTKLARVGGHNDFRHNGATKSLTFPSLTEVDGRLHISDNAELESVDARKLRNLGRKWLNWHSPEPFASSGSHLNVAGNRALQSLNLTALEAVGGQVLVTGNCKIQDLNLPELKVVYLMIDISNNSRLENVTMANLADISTYDRGGRIVDWRSRFSHLHVTSNMALRSLQFPRVRSVGGYVYIASNSDLDTITADSVSVVGSYLVVTNNSALPDTLRLPGLTKVGGDFEISDNFALSGVEASALAEVGGDLLIEGSPELQTLLLPSLTTVRGPIDISANYVGEPKERGTSTGRSSQGVTHLSVVNNAMLESLILTNLAVIVRGDLGVSGNKRMRTLALGVINVSSWCQITGNDNLIDMEMGELIYVGKRVDIVDNARLRAARLPKFFPSNESPLHIKNNTVMEGRLIDFAACGSTFPAETEDFESRSSKLCDNIKEAIVMEDIPSFTCSWIGVKGNDADEDEDEGEYACDQCPSGFRPAYSNGNFFCEEEFDKSQYILILVMPVVGVAGVIIAHQLAVWTLYGRDEHGGRIELVHFRSNSPTVGALALDLFVSTTDVVTDTIFIFLGLPGSCGDDSTEHMLGLLSNLFLWVPMGVGMLIAICVIVHRRPGKGPTYLPRASHGAALRFPEPRWCAVPLWVTSTLVFITSAASLGAIKLLPWDNVNESNDGDGTREEEEKKRVLKAVAENDHYPDYYVVPDRSAGGSRGGEWSVDVVRLKRLANRLFWYDVSLMIVEDAAQLVIQFAFLGQCRPTESAFISTSSSLALTIIRLLRGLYGIIDRVKRAWDASPPKESKEVAQSASQVDAPRSPSGAKGPPEAAHSAALEEGVSTEVEDGVPAEGVGGEPHIT